jgi:hypothetical protein
MLQPVTYHLLFLFPVTCYLARVQLLKNLAKKVLGRFQILVLGENLLHHAHCFAARILQLLEHLEGFLFQRQRRIPVQRKGVLRCANANLAIFPRNSVMILSEVLAPIRAVPSGKQCHHPQWPWRFR